MGFCGNCGAKVDEGIAFCGGCGNQMNQAANTSSAMNTTSAVNTTVNEPVAVAGSMAIGDVATHANNAAAEESKKKKFGKIKFWGGCAIALCVLVAFLFTNQKKDSALEYINEERYQLVEQYIALDELYRSVAEVTDEEALEVLYTILIPDSYALLKVLQKMKIDDKEVAEIHNLLISSVDNFYESCNEWLKWIDSYDSAALLKSDTLYFDSDDDWNAYTDRLDELVKSRGLEWENE